MPEISIFDIVGPIMVGPSSSHTAGAVRLGLAARTLLGETPRHALLQLHGSFAATYWGHKTDYALIAGLLGMNMADLHIPKAKQWAKNQGMDYQLETVDLGEVHPNSVRFVLQGEKSNVSMRGQSTGGGRIEIREIDGFPLSCDGNYAVLMTKYRDEPGMIAVITALLAKWGVNIAFMEVSRKKRGAEALLVAQMDDIIDETQVQEVWKVKGIQSVRLMPRL